MKSCFYHFFRFHGLLFPSHLFVIRLSPDSELYIFQSEDRVQRIKVNRCDVKKKNNPRGQRIQQKKKTKPGREKTIHRAEQ